MKPTMTIINLKEFQTVLSKLKGAVRGQSLIKAARAGGGVIQTNARMNASAGRPGLDMDTGALVNSIIVEDGKSSTNNASVNVGPTVEYGRIHEFGGVIKPIAAKMLSWINEQGERVFANAVTIPARPYMRPAVDEHMGDIKTAVGDSLRASIEEAARGNA